MKVFKGKIVIFFMAILLLFITGCQDTKKQEHTPDPSADYTLAAKTSAGSVHEVEKGFYRIEDINGYYYVKYADKSDMENWVYLCNKPNCEHDDYDCNAYIQTGFPVMWLYEDKIYYNNDLFQELYKMNLDGSNHEKVRDLQGAMLAANGGVGTTYYNMNGKIIYSILPSLPEGYGELPERDFTMYDISFMDEKEDKIVFERTVYSVFADEFPFYLSYSTGYYKGVDVFCLLTSEGSQQPIEISEVYFEYDEETNSLVEIKADILYRQRSYFEGDLGYYYDKGFVRRNMETGEIVRISDAALDNGDGLTTDNHFLEFNKRGISEEEKKLLIYDREGKLLNEFNFDRDSEIVQISHEMYWTSDRLFFSIIYKDLSEENFYIFYDDIGKADAKPHYSYTNSWKGIWRLEDFE